MARNQLTPVSIAGIEFDALIDEQKDMNATIPSYPIEDGFQVSDTIILDPLQVKMTLYITNTPVTWLYRHGNSVTRVNSIVNQLENLWFSKKLVKIVTTDVTYTNMGIVSISVKKSQSIGYAREVSIQARKVLVTTRKTVKIPKSVLKSGKSKASAGKASTSKTSKKKSSTSKSSSSTKKTTSSKSSSTSKSSSSSKGSTSSAKKSQSVLYGAAKGMGFV